MRSFSIKQSAILVVFLCGIFFFAHFAAFTQDAAESPGREANLPVLTHEYLAGVWHGTSVLGITPLLRYTEDGTFTSGLLDAFGKEFPVCAGNYSISGNVITEIVVSVEAGFFGKISRIKAGKTVMHMRVQADGTLLSEDVPFGGKVVFSKM